MTDSTHTHTKTFDVSLIASNLASLHAFVTRTNGRIEITRPGTDDHCVLISKDELDALERALEILSDTDTVRAMCGQISELAAATTGPAVAVEA